MRKTVSGMMLVLLFIGMLALAFDIQIVNYVYAQEAETLTPYFVILWTSDFPGGDYIMIKNKIAYFAERRWGGTWISRSGTTFFHSLNLSDGSQPWNYSANDCLTVAIDDERVYFGSNNGYLMAVDAQRGLFLWKVNLAGAVLANPVIVNGTIYVGAGDTIYGISAFGEIVWQKRIPSQPREDNLIGEMSGGICDPGVSVKTEIISLFHSENSLFGVITHEKYVCGGSWSKKYASSDIFAVDLNSYEIKWLVPSPCYDKALVGVSDSFIYFGVDPIHALNSSTGVFVWNYTTNLFHGSAKVQQIADDLILILMDSGVTCLNLTTRDVTWSSSGVVFGNTLYSCRSKQIVIDNEVVLRIELRAIDCFSGNVSWEYTFVDLEEGGAYPVVCNDTLLLLCSDKIYAFKYLIDITAPIILITSPDPSYEARSSSITVAWTGSDDFSGISYYEIRLDGGSWISIGTNTTYTFTELGDGSHTVDIKAVDKAGNVKQETVSFIVNTSPLFGPGYIEEIAIVATMITIVLATALYLFIIRKHKSKS